MGFWNRFPYTNFHELNLDWFNQEFEKIFAQWDELYSTMNEWKDNTDRDLNEWKQNTLSDIESWENDVLDGLNQWKTATGEDISDWESEVIADLNTWKQDFIDAYEALEDRVDAIVSYTEDMVENLAEPFSTTKNYISGEYVVQNGILYKFTSDHSAGAWMESDAIQVTAMKDIDDLNNDLIVDEYFTNEGIFKVTANMLENGVWYRGAKSEAANRGRVKRMIPVKAGMRLNIEVSDFDIFWGVASNRTWTNYSQGGNTGTWVTAVGNTVVNITVDGYLIIHIRDHNDTSANVDVTTFNQNVNVETYIHITYTNESTAFIPRGILANNSDLNTILNPGVYVLQSGYTYSNCPINTAGIAGTLNVFKGSANTILEIVNTITDSNPEIYRVYYRNILLASSNPQYLKWVPINREFILESTGDNTDRTSEVARVIDVLGYIKFGTGIFYLDNITLPEDCEVSGAGASLTKVYYKTGILNKAVFDLNNRCSIHDLTLMGSDSDERSPSPTERNAIDFVGDYVYQQGGDGFERCMLYNLRIKNFSGSGIKLSHTGPSIDNHCILNNIEIEGCGIGINIDYSSEYHRITNCVMQGNWYGMINNGGNNIIMNCDFSGNVIGLFMDDTPSGSSVNNSHGDYLGCTFNHSYNSSLEANKGCAIYLKGMDLGEVFTGCQVYYGSLIVEGCTGIRFVGLNVGTSVPIRLTNNTLITFSDSTFKDAPDSTASPVTLSGNTACVFTNCYLRNGTVYDPTV